MDRFDIAVIGGGLHGLSAALHLARQRLRVVVLERDWCGRHASGASAAGVRTLGRDPAELPLSLKSMEMWHDIAGLVGDDCGFHAHGQIQAASSEEDLEKIANHVADLHARGYYNESLIDQNELRVLVPGIAPHLVGAAYAPGDGAADPHRTVTAFRRASMTAGVEIREHCAVTALKMIDQSWEIETTGVKISAGGVINAAGAWGAKIAAMAGQHVPYAAKAPMMMITEPVAPLVRQVLGIRGRKLSFKQTSQGGLLIGGGLRGGFDLNTGRLTLDFQALSEGAKAAQELFPMIGALRILRCWNAIEGMTDDLLPVICPSASASNLWHVFGFGGHGFQLVPAVGSAVAEMVTSRHVPSIIAAFDAKRLSVRRHPSP
jgi:sarcosine oxidase subunit beta